MRMKSRASTLPPTYPPSKREFLVPIYNYTLQSRNTFQPTSQHTYPLIHSQKVNSKQPTLQQSIFYSNYITCTLLHDKPTYLPSNMNTFQYI